MKKFWAMFDADDTLLGVTVNGETVGTHMAYKDVLRRYADRMEREGFDRSTALNRQLTIDKAAAETRGFSDKSRFPLSLRQAYTELANEPGTFNSATAQQIEDIGWSVFTDYPYVALPGALQTLHTVSKEYNIAIVTKGEDEEQRKKVFDSGCFVYADQVITMGHKSLDEWDEKVVRPLRLTTAVRKFSWAIGNSAKSDVNPPLLLGFNGLLLATDETWEFERGGVVPAMADREFAHINEIHETVKFLLPSES